MKRIRCLAQARVRCGSDSASTPFTRSPAELTDLGITDTGTHGLHRVLWVGDPFPKDSVYCSTQSQVGRANSGFALCTLKQTASTTSTARPSPVTWTQAWGASGRRQVEAPGWHLKRARGLWWPAALGQPRPPPHPPVPTWVVAEDVTGVLQHLVILPPPQQALAVVQDQGVDHLLQLQPLRLPGLLLPAEKSCVCSGCGPTPPPRPRPGRADSRWRPPPTLVCRFLRQMMASWYLVEASS